jgi:type III secretion system low calcium response chaperone LcrH/SycD
MFDTPANKPIKVNLLDKEVLESLAKEVLLKMEENPGMTIQDAIGISDQALEEVYSLAHTFYNQGKYEKALPLFHFLTGTSPKTYKYVFGLAASYHQIEKYEEAVSGFYIAMHLDLGNPIPAYYITDCFLKQNLQQQALAFAELTIELCEENPEHMILKNRVKLIKDSLKANK